MHWTDDALLISVRRHGESSSILSLLTRERGRHHGLLRGSVRRAGLQPGTHVRATWRSRLAENLGTLACETVTALDPRILYDRPRLAALAALCALLETALAEREPAPGLYEDASLLLAAMAETDDWSIAYVAWEVNLLASLGFGLDLRRCAATGRTDDLAYVSPRTGRAVCRSAGLPYAERLLPLPAFLLDPAEGPRDPAEVAGGLRLTGYFLERHVYAPRHHRLPPARARLAAAWERQAAGDPNGAVF